MKRQLTIVCLIVLISSLTKAIAQERHNHNFEERCLTQYYYEESVKENPQIAINRHLLDYEIRQAQENGGVARQTGVVKIIPVVVHVIHEGGPENISKAQIQSQIDVLNNDFRRLNADTTNIPAVWKSIAADVEVEFRLAKLDPSGNCTDGIVRVFSHLTNNARNNVKALSYWPRDKYLNIWVVKSIENTSGVSGIIVGFAQFPGGLAATDGVELRHDFFGTIGTAASSNYGARSACHEVGHWLGLRHIWGDSNCGNDFISDTPPAEGAHYGCATHPYHVNMCGAGTSPNGEMFMNYMDYSDGICENMFTMGQKTAMTTTLNSSISGRNNLWTASNLAATGADGGSYPLCAPVADFNPQPQYICAGTSLTFKDMSWNGDVSSWDWTFQGGTPSSSNDTNPVITYYTPGDYSVTLTVTNAAGSSTKTITNLVRVATATGTVNAYPFTESFESGNFPPAEWYVDNESLNTNEWELTSLASHSGFNSVMLNNITGNTNGVDELITTTFDFSNVTNPKLTFWRAFAMTNSTGTPRLRVMVSTDCGKLWSVRYNRSASQITTAPVYSGNFIPTVAQWAKDSTSSLNAAYSGKQNVRFKFEYTQDGGNNIYLDDINIDGVLGINENSVNSSLSVYPNPSIAQSKVEFELDQNAEVSIEIHDLSGRVVQTLTKSILPQGSYVYDIFNLSPGSYTVTVTANHVASTRKLIIQ